MRVGLTLGVVGCISGMVGGSVAACSGNGGNGGKSDASADTSTFDAVVRPDQSQVDTGGDDSNGGDDAGCAPLPVEAGFPFAPPNPQRSVCTATQIQTLYNECWGGAPGCTAFYGDPTNSTCIACMHTQSTASSWGPLVEFPDQVTYANASGCMAIVTPDAGGTDCAHAVEAEVRCRQASCAPNCPNASTAAGLAEYEQCETKAETTTCATEVQTAAPCYSDPRYAPCVFVSFEAYVVGLGEFFCAANTGGDAGPDATGDGPSDGGGG